MGFLVLLATVQLWNLLDPNPRLQVVSRAPSKAWDSFLLFILILLTGYAIAVSPRSHCLFLKAVLALESHCLPEKALYQKPLVQVSNEFWRKE